MDPINLTKTLNCSSCEAFDMWTKPEYLAHFFGEGHLIELKKNGPYEIYFSMTEPAGIRGSEGCKIIDFEKAKFLSFTWNAPPSIPAVRNSGRYTRVKLDFKDREVGKCELNLVHDGWTYEGEDWEKTHAYFQQAWPYVLNQLEIALNKRTEN